ncbi:MAG TPA: hypothetical protein VMB80_18440 [Candidatus Acidoferrum sp.]|nr:hypothetical protein [Candidatus Acidoferrum sp.]
MKNQTPVKPTPGQPEGGVASDILGYLSKHPKAEDTLEGILQWLTTEKQVQTSPGIVAHALAQLIEKRIVTAQQSAGSPTIYHFNSPAKAA